MFDHISTYATDYLKTKDFYQAVFAPLGYSIQAEFVASWNSDFPTQRLCAFGKNGEYSLWIIEVKTPFTPRHVAFASPDRESVDAFYAAGIAVGARDNGKPGLRPDYHPTYYGAFLLDPDDNNVEAVCHRPE
ncbi:glyoxalase [Brenneria goodwinii]|uniref:Glyoxalase n=1 Tax=Brenneria goodwinii TaxID=1109412 RepID=A0A0G4K0N6_9GAMM|nr:VOC family protein [Brenneria goodwinii]ATA23983.1 glyoxalase [Brenneria goodwinii]MCG8156608.1 VOC family protein [Brenneria goodwinii]MCG8159676.1 VOC family protein [Brenneria goodwinii]MCG8165766.1 VOC family protein [Brenneria goodwinii]MCG8170273.1 VOC family protein [Brenneria goodwinii]